MYHYIYYLVSATYQNANFDRGCCVSNSNFHRRCNCKNVSNPDCRNLCSLDTGCKGYATHEAGVCNLATNSSCPFDCDGPYNGENIGKIDPTALCGTNGKWNGGCMIKSSTMLHKNIFSKMAKHSFFYTIY